MTEEQNSQENKQQETQANDKAFNFRQLEAKFERQMAQQRLESENQLKKVQEEYESKLKQFQNPAQEEDDDDYVDGRKLQRRFSDFERSIEEKFDKRAEEKAEKILRNKEKDMWLKQNPDFFDVLENYADKFAEENPDMAEDILRMPPGFERQRLTYKNIKLLGMTKPKESIQDKVNQRQSGPYYQPTNVSNAPHSVQGDYSPQGQKKAYEHMQNLKNRLRI